MIAEKEELFSHDIWIWSARNMGPIAARMIVNNGGIVKGFIDNDKKIQNSQVFNRPVYNPDVFYDLMSLNDIVLVCCTKENNKNIIQQLNEHGVKNIRELDLKMFDSVQKKFGEFIEDGYESRSISKICCQEDFKKDFFIKIQNELGWNNHSRYHRKIWEFVYIVKILKDHNMLKEGKRGLGFAVGEEPLASYFASKKVSVLASDLGIENETAEIWKESRQNASGDINKIWKENIISRNQFDKYVKYMDLDMNHIPDDIGEYDFCWSSCAIEHVGGLDLSKQFLKNMIKVLKPGGVAVHTTEFNLWSNDDTEKNGYSVIYRKKDLEEIAEWLKTQGCKMELSFKREPSNVNMFLPMPPYESDDMRDHLNLMVGGFASTSYGIVIIKEKSLSGTDNFSEERDVLSGKRKT